MAASISPRQTCASALRRQDSGARMPRTARRCHRIARMRAASLVRSTRTVGFARLLHRLAINGRPHRVARAPGAACGCGRRQRHFAGPRIRMTDPARDAEHVGRSGHTHQSGIPCTGRCSSARADRRVHRARRAAGSLKSRIARSWHVNWFIFGERNRAHDGFHVGELSCWHEAGMPKRLDRVWSCDGMPLRHVQDVLRVNGALLTNGSRPARRSMCAATRPNSPGTHRAGYSRVSCHGRDFLR